MNERRATRKSKLNTNAKILFTEILMTVALVVFIAVVLGNKVRDDVKLDTILTKVLPEITTKDHMEEGGAMKLRSLYGLSENDYEEVVLFVPASNMDAQELLLVRCKSEAQTEAVKSAAEARIKYLTSIFESYGVEQMALINKAVVDVQGNYVLYVCAAESRTVDEIFRKTLKERGK